MSRNTSSQTNVQVSQSISYHSNSFYNYQQLPDLNDRIGFRISHLFNNSNIQSRIYYLGNLNLFKTYSERLYHTHTFGYDGYLERSEGKRIYYLGGYLSWHDSQKIYNVIDSRELSSYMNAKYYLRKNVIARFGYQINNSQYKELPELGHWEHLALIQINTFFQTGTSLTFNTSYGLKNYNTGNIDGFSRRSVDQMVNSIKLGQSLGAATSITLRLLNRTNPGLVHGSDSFIFSDYQWGENELFDDRYDYCGHEIFLTFTHFLPYYIKLELGANRYWKQYHSQKIFDLGSIQSVSDEYRNDKRSLFWLRLSRNVKVNWGIEKIRISLEGGYLRNNSNESYYTFNNLFGSLRTEFSLK
jgi:hypothetical protein